MSRTISTPCAVLTCLTLLSAVLNAQEGRNFTPEQIQRFREMRERGGGEAFRGRSRGSEGERPDRGGPGFDRDSNRGGGESDGGYRWRGDREGGSEGGRSGGRGPGGGEAAAPAETARTPQAAKIERKPKPRYTIDLPTLFTEFDSDGDRQLGLYEWKKSKRSVADFNRFDLDGDGFLTPSELAKIDALPAPNSTSIAVVTPSASPVENTARQDGPSPVAARPDAAGTKRLAATTPVAARPAAPPAEVDWDSPMAKQAKRLFDILDRDKDGAVSAAEWSRGTRVRPQFEEAGLDLTQPMSSQQFVAHYVQLNAPKS